jgi:hypothetical protein
MSKLLHSIHTTTKGVSVDIRDKKKLKCIHAELLVIRALIDSSLGDSLPPKVEMSLHCARLHMLTAIKEAV